MEMTESEITIEQAASKTIAEILAAGPAAQQVDLVFDLRAADGVDEVVQRAVAADEDDLVLRRKAAEVGRVIQADGVDELGPLGHRGLDAVVGQRVVKIAFHVLPPIKNLFYSNPRTIISSPIE